MSLHQLANHMSARGRGPDSTLVHMSPREVEGLQKLAVAHGTTLTINPDTGLPEAFSLKDLLPTLAGAALNYFLPGVGTAIGEVVGLGSAAGTGLAVGAATAALTGDLGKGLSAGLGAYGGAGITDSLAGMGAAQLGSQAVEEGVGQKLSDQALQESVANRMASSTMADKVGAGLSYAGSNPMSALKIGGKYLAAAAAPIFAGEVGNTVQTTTPRQSTGSIRPFTYDPHSQTYTRETPYAAAKGGLMSLANGGPVGSTAPEMTLDQMYQNVLGREADTGGREFWASQFGDKVDDTELAAFRQSALGGTSTADKAAAQSFGAPVSTTGLSALDRDNAPFGAPASTTGQGFAAAPQPRPPAPPAQNFGGQGDIGNNLTNMAPVQDARADEAAFTAAGNAANNAGIASLANTTGAMGAVNANTAATTPKITDQVYDLFKNVLDRAPSQADMDYWATAFGKNNNTIDPSEINDFKSAASKELSARTADFDSSKNYIPISQLDNLYMQELSRHGEYGTGGKEGGMEFWRRTFGDYINPEELAGFRTEAAKERAAREKATMPDVVTDLTTADTTYVKPGVGGSTGAGQIGGGTVINPNGTITTSPVIPGISVGGFKGMTGVRDAYTTGGGSLGYTSPTYTKAEFDAKYKNTGYQKEMYDYLMGKGDKPTQMKNADGTFREIMRSYKEATLGVPGSTNKRLIWDKTKGTYFTNPDYIRQQTIIDPTTKERSAINYMSINQAKDALKKTPLEGNALANWSIANFVDPATLAEATGMTYAQVSALLAKAKADRAYTKKAGGLMSLANGGLAAGGMPDKEFTDNTTGIKYYFDFANGMYRAETSVKDGITYRWNPVSNKYEPISSSGAGTGIASLMESGGPPGGPGPGPDMGGGIPGATMVDGISGKTTGLASMANSLAATLGNMSGGSGILRGISDAIARNVDPSFSHEGRAGRGASDSGTNPNTGDTGTSTNTGNTGMNTGTSGGSPEQAGDIGNPGGPAGSNGPGGDPALNAKGGYIGHYAQGGLGSLGGYSDGGRLLRGPGDGVSDSIPASIGDRQPARLADGEFVVPARIVSELGNGSTEAGARALYKMMDRIQANRRKTTGKNRVAVDSKSHKYLPA